MLNVRADSPKEAIELTPRTRPPLPFNCCAAKQTITCWSSDTQPPLAPVLIEDDLFEVRIKALTEK